METSRDRAKASATARAKPQNKNSRLSNMQGRQSTAQGNSLSFFTEEAQGLKLSPYTVMVLCLMYIGIVVMLHIVSKVKGSSSPKADINMAPPDGGDL
jgi:preprotein translocase subunit Sec61beta